MSEPLVTIVCLSYNHAPFAGETIASLLAQTYRNLEVIVFDNASTDGTLAAIRAAVPPGETRVRVVASPENLGVCRGLNAALAHVGGAYVSIIAADDRLHPDKVRRQVEAAEAFGRPAVVSCTGCQIDVAGKVVNPRVGFPPPGEDPLLAMLRKNWINAMAPLVPRVALTEVGPFDERLDFEDWDLWVRLLMRYPWIHLDEVLCDYRVIPGSLHGSLSQAKFQRTRALMRRKALGHSLAASAVAMRLLLTDLAFLREGDASRYAEVRDALWSDSRRPYGWIVVALEPAFRLLRGLRRRLSSRR